MKVGWNQLSSLPNTINGLQNLTTLEAQVNQINQLPKTISSLQLLNIYLSDNQITVFPNEICNLLKLRELDLAWNKIP